VSGTIAEQVNNRRAVTGLAYHVKIMPLRVLDSKGNGNGSTLARAIRWAARHHADVMNLSVEFDSELRAADIPDVISAIRYAHRHGVVMSGSAGNDGGSGLSYPARAKQVIAVGATTAHGCRADYSNTGSGLDVTAPGGGEDSGPGDDDWDRAHCRPGGSGRAIYQQTFGSNRRHFRLIGYDGTSESAPHVSALGALVIASGVLGRNPSPDAVKARIEDTARDLGAPGFDHRYGHGLIDAEAAVGG